MLWAGAYSPSRNRLTAPSATASRDRRGLCPRATHEADLPLLGRSKRLTRLLSLDPLPIGVPEVGERRKGAAMPPRGVKKAPSEHASTSTSRRARRKRGGRRTGPRRSRPAPSTGKRRAPGNRRPPRAARPGVAPLAAAEASAPAAAPAAAPANSSTTTPGSWGSRSLEDEQEPAPARGGRRRKLRVTGEGLDEAGASSDRAPGSGVDRVDD